MSTSGTPRKKLPLGRRSTVGSTRRQRSGRLCCLNRAARPRADEARDARRRHGRVAWAAARRRRCRPRPRRVRALEKYVARFADDGLRRAPIQPAAAASTRRVARSARRLGDVDEAEAPIAVAAVRRAADGAGQAVAWPPVVPVAEDAALDRRFVGVRAPPSPRAPRASRRQRPPKGVARREASAAPARRGRRRARRAASSAALSACRSAREEQKSLRASSARSVPSGRAPLVRGAGARGRRRRRGRPPASRGRCAPNFAASCRRARSSARGTRRSSARARRWKHDEETGPSGAATSGTRRARRRWTVLAFGVGRARREIDEARSLFVCRRSLRPQQRAVAHADAAKIVPRVLTRRHPLAVAMRPRAHSEQRRRGGSPRHRGRAAARPRRIQSCGRSARRPAAARHGAAQTHCMLHDGRRAQRRTRRPPRHAIRRGARGPVDRRHLRAAARGDELGACAKPPTSPCRRRRRRRTSTAAGARARRSRCAPRSSRTSLADAAGAGGRKVARGVRSAASTAPPPPTRVARRAPARRAATWRAPPAATRRRHLAARRSRPPAAGGAQRACGRVGARSASTAGELARRRRAPTQTRRERAPAARRVRAHLLAAAPSPLARSRPPPPRSLPPPGVRPAARTTRRRRRAARRRRTRTPTCASRRRTRVRRRRPPRHARAYRAAGGGGVRRAAAATASGGRGGRRSTRRRRGARRAAAIRHRAVGCARIDGGDCAHRLRRLAPRRVRRRRRSGRRARSRGSTTATAQRGAFCHAAVCSPRAARRACARRRGGAAAAAPVRARCSPLRRRVAARAWTVAPSRARARRDHRDGVALLAARARRRASRRPSRCQSSDRGSSRARGLALARHRRARPPPRDPSPAPPSEPQGQSRRRGA